ncbi:MAG TPA: 4-(cytidine 5'-diphospho)-2-C-methyl-D-erythritol kinase [Parachlamydiaceae bacterium]|nr:4-(cytidine 5'-diphospho)-2-C-methyl-D-erythritol kinase [Parachlamydiaceae bacterium]
MLSLQSPAKINFFLRILRKRPDGYHDLASLFQAIDLCDTMHFDLAENDAFTCSDPSLPTDATNLVSKARDLFRKKTGIKHCFSINLHKKIPQHAGLGGGSSNAATTLWALNNLCGKKATDKQLSDWGAEIGSDIPFFLSQGTAYCTGRGEILRGLAPLENQTIWIVKPPIGLSTQRVYGQLDIKDSNPEYVAKQILELESILPEFALSQRTKDETIYFNDLEEPAFKLAPQLGALKQKLEGYGFSSVLMSGSGSSFFCVGGKDLLLNIPDCQTFKCQHINRDHSRWY